MFRSRSVNHWDENKMFPLTPIYVRLMVEELIQTYTKHIKRSFVEFVNIIKRDDLK